MPSIWPRASSRQSRRVWPLVDAELQARRAGVEYECVVVHTDTSYGLRPARMGRQHRDSATGNPRPHAVGPAGQDDRHPRAEHQPGAVGIGQEAELLGQDVAGFEIRREKNVGIAGDLRVNALGFGGLLADRVVERQWAVENAAGDLSALGHLAKRRGVDRGRHLRSHRFDRGENRDLGPFTPSEMARSIAFWQMSTLSSSVGAMLIAASVTISTL